jgi:hypothetical protein
MYADEILSDARLVARLRAARFPHRRVGVPDKERRQRALVVRA